VCPFCFSTMAIVVVGAASTGGVAAIVFKKVRAHDDAEILTNKPEGVENATENRFAQ
jgi:hypothetical protein